jgi:hypothetical protein
MDWNVAQIVENLTSKCEEALSSNPNTLPPKKRKYMYL